MDGRTPARRLSVTSRAAAGEGTLLVRSVGWGTGWRRLFLQRASCWPAAWLGTAGHPGTPSSPALKTSAVVPADEQPVSGRREALKLSPPAPTAREVHFGAGVVGDFRRASLRSGRGDSSGSTETSRWRGDAGSSEGQRGGGTGQGAAGAAPCRGSAGWDTGGCGARRRGDEPAAGCGVGGCCRRLWGL